MVAISVVSRSRVGSFDPLILVYPHELIGSAAQEAGAVGCLIFTDPGDDGDITEENGYEQYPDGPARQVSFSSLGRQDNG